MEHSYDALTGDGFSRPLCLALIVAVQLVCRSVVSEGGSPRSGTMVVSHSFFRVPERDGERDGFVTGGPVLLRGCLMSGVGGWHSHSFTRGTVEFGKSSVRMETSDWLGTVVRGATDASPRFTKAVVRVAASIPRGRRTAVAKDWVPIVGWCARNFFRASIKERRSLARSSWMAFPWRKTGHFLSADACAPQQFTQWAGLGHRSFPCPPSPHWPQTRWVAHLCWVCPNFWHR
jgi:hypothetical protein